MSDALANLDLVLDTRGTKRDLGAFVVGCGFAGEVAAFALGDGLVHLTPSAGEWRVVEVHSGAVLSFAAGAWDFLSGGDDGRLVRMSRDSTVAEVAKHGSRWVEQVAGFADGKTILFAASVGKNVHVSDGSGAAVKTLAHPSSVTGLAFDAKGKRIAASHYNGVSLWFVASSADKPRVLEWKGSHLAVAISPDGDSVVSAMQENALHGWRLSDGQHMRMSGYPSKPRALGFTKSGRWLASSGAEAVVLWPFTGGGPMGKAPRELAGRDGVTCTALACHPRDETVAAGFSDGVVVLADVATQRVLPIAGPGRGSVSAVAWDAAGARLAFGTEDGFAALVDLSAR